MTYSPTCWWLVRHAATDVPSGMIVGDLDVSCAPLDPVRIASLAKRLPSQALLVESGLRRCRQTTEALIEAGASLFSAPLIDPALREQNLGQWQGYNWNDDHLNTDPVVSAFWEDPASNRPPSGESFADVVVRVRASLTALSAAHRGRDLVAVLHAGSIRAALAVALDIPPRAALRFGIDYLSLTRLALFDDGNWAVEAVNA